MRKTIVLYPSRGGGFVSMGKGTVQAERVRFAALPAGRARQRPAARALAEPDGGEGRTTRPGGQPRTVEAA